jgi:hypothetical protein
MISRRPNYRGIRRPAMIDRSILVPIQTGRMLMLQL